MLKLTNPRLRRSNVMLNSFSSCISNTSKEFSWTPEMSFPEIVSQARMLLHQSESAIPFEQLQSFANANSWWYLNKQMDMVNSNMELINFEPFSVSNLPKEELTIHPQPIKFERVFGIFNFPHKVEGILSEAMLPRFQIHFLSPKSAGDKADANLMVYFEESSISTSPNTQQKELNLLEDGDSSPSLKTWVSSPWM